MEESVGFFYFNQGIYFKPTNLEASWLKKRIKNPYTVKQHLKNIYMCIFLDKLNL